MFTVSHHRAPKPKSEWEYLQNRLDTIGYQSSDEKTLLRLLKSVPSTKITSLQEKILSNPQIRDLYNTKSGERFLAKTITKLDIHHVKILISCNHPLSGVNTANDSALLLAIRLESIDIVRHILSISSEDELKAVNNDEIYPLKEAISTNNHKIILDVLQSVDNISKLIPNKFLSIGTEMNFLRTLFNLKNESIALEAVQRSKNIHLLHDEWGKTALYLAHYNKFPLVAEKLHRLGIHYYFSLPNISTRSLAHSVCLFAARYKNLVQNKAFHSAGCYSTHTTPILRYFYWKYMQSIQTSKKTFLKLALPNKYFIKDVSNALLLSSTQATNDTLYNTYLKNKPIIISTGWIGHEISVVIYADFIAICNRGELGLHQTHALELYKINKQKLSLEIINEIQGCKIQDKTVSENYLYQDLLTELAADKDHFCTTIQNKITSIKNQKHGNCTAASPKLGILALHIIYNKNNNILINDNIFKSTLDLYHTFSRYLREEIKNTLEARTNNK